MSINLWGAFLGGILALLSPCSVMLLPAFFAYAFPNSGKLFSRTGFFLAGLIVTLVPIGALAGSLGGWITLHRGALLMWIAGFIILLGLVMVSGIPLPGISRSAPGTGASAVSIFSLGMVYGLAGGCAGPVFGAILALSAFGGSAVAGAVTMLVYAIGMVVPLVVLALLWDRLPLVRSLVRPREVRIGRWRNTWMMLIGGLLTIAVGVLLLATDGTLALTGVLGVQTQASLESGMMQRAAGVPDWAVVVGMFAIGALAWWLTRRQRRAAVD